MAPSLLPPALLRGYHEGGREARGEARDPNPL